MYNLEKIENKKVLLKIDLSAANYYSHSLRSELKTLKMLMQKNNGICIVATIGPAFLVPGVSCKPFVKFFEQNLKVAVKWLSSIDEAKIEKGKIYLLENTLLDKRELACDFEFIEKFKAMFDIMVLDTLINLDANYASSQGFIREKMPYVFGCGLLRLVTLRDLLWRSKIGLVLGGGNVSCQLRFITIMIQQIRFIAVGGEVGLLMMGKSTTIYGYIKKLLMAVMALLRQYKIKVLYPMDVIAYSPDSQRNRLALYQDLDESEMVFDLGRHTVDRILSQIKESDLDVVIISGAIGHVLDPRYSRGSDNLMKGLVDQKVIKVIIGKYDEMVANRLGLIDHYDYMLEDDPVNMRFLTQPRSLEDYIQEVALSVGDEVEDVV